MVTDVNDFRLDLARRMGATRTVRADREKLSDVVRELKMSNGFDVGLEMSGSAKALRDMIDSMYNGGRIALLGFLPLRPRSIGTR